MMTNKQSGFDTPGASVHRHPPLKCLGLFAWSATRPRIARLRTLLLRSLASFTAKHLEDVGGCGQIALHHLLCGRKVLHGTRRKAGKDLGLRFAFASTVLTPLCRPDLSHAEPPHPQPNALSTRYNQEPQNLPSEAPCFAGAGVMAPFCPAIRSPH